MKRLGWALLIAVLMLVLAAAAIPAGAQQSDGRDRSGTQFSARLTGFEETPAIFSRGRGEFRARLTGGDRLDYELRYSPLEAPATVAHIHFAQRNVAGGVIAFLCGGGNKPPCPPAGGTVTGTITAADVVGPAEQGIEPGEFGKLVTAMRAGVTYANVHSTKFPGGEIRGQIRRGEGRDGQADGDQNQQ